MFASRFLLYSLLFCCAEVWQIAANAQSVTGRLRAIGMENIRCAETERTITVAFEDNVYRSTYQGIEEAIGACIENGTGKSLRLVVLDNRIPRLCISLPDTLLDAYRKKQISQTQLYSRMGISVDTDCAMEVIRNAESTANPSAWKTDIVVYPELFLKNNSLNKLYTYAINLSPAVEIGLWKGGRLTAQVVFPVATNLYGEYRKIHPGVMTLSQEVRFKHNIFGRISAGNFTHNRMGVQADMRYKTDNGRVELGALAGATVFSGIVDDEGWYISATPRMNAFLRASLYEPHTNLQFDLQGGRYIYGDYGVRGDCTRHFGEYTVGLYAQYTEGEINGGFHFALPLPSKKWKRNRTIRIKPADHFAWAYSMVSHGKYINEQMGRTYNVRPDENKSNNFYQPDYIRYFLIKESERKSKIRIINTNSNLKTKL